MISKRNCRGAVQSVLLQTLSLNGYRPAESGEEQTQISRKIIERSRRPTPSDRPNVSGAERAQAYVDAAAGEGASRSLALAAALGQLCGLVSAQLDSNLGFTSACPSSRLPSRVDQLNAACCVAAGDGSSGECAGTCTTDCIGTLFPLLDDCRDVLNTQFDTSDGIEDGVASAVTRIEDDCNRVEPENLVDMLMTLQTEGKCPPTVLDGIGETVVKDEACANAWTGGRCEMSIASGVFSCAADFCDTCDLPGQCDNSCAFCGDKDGAGHRRRRRAMLEEEFRRKMQMGHVQCDPATFAAQAAAVEDACCDADGSACPDGTPVQCDAKCAVVFNNFYSRCQRFMAAQFSPAEMGSYDRLYTTCTASLPAQPLLRALVVCSNRAPDPCWRVDCGQHGSCRGGSCQCETGYEGSSCQTRGWHLAPGGAHVCDFGAPASQAQCEALVVQIAASEGLQVSTAGLQVESWRGSCLDDGWGQVPVGCSMQTGNNGCTPHFKTSGDTGVGCIAQMYRLVCH